MQIVVKGHHTKVPERFRRHVSEKLAKIERLAERTETVDVLLSTERNPRLSSCSERVELTVRSPGPVVRAEAQAGDAYSAFDSAWAKLEARLRKLKDKRKIHRGQRRPVSVSRATAPLAGTVLADDLVASSNGSAHRASEPGEFPDEDTQSVVQVEMDGNGPLIVREKAHTAGPMSIEQALLAMELVGHDFYLFRDTATDKPSVVYRRRGYDYGVIRLEEEHAEQRA